MKLRVTIDLDVSHTMGQTIRRAGFTVCQDGRGFQLRIPNHPPITKRKCQVQFEEIDGLHKGSGQSQQNESSNETEQDPGTV